MMGLGESIGYEDQAVGHQSLRMLADMQFDKAVFGHGKPIMSDASEKFKAKWAD
jgi:hypothetical protein